MSGSVAERLGLVVLLDPEAAAADFAWTVDAVLEPSPPAVQLRAKGASAQELEELARGIAPKVRAAGALFFVNDRPDVAMAVGADGVHVGPHDVPVNRLRDRVPDGFLLGASGDNATEARRLELAGADYIGCGTVYPTVSKPDAGEVIGVTGVSNVVEAVGIPVVGIGGITPERAAEVLSSGCVGIAVLGAVMAARSPSDVVAALMEVVESRRAGRLAEEYHSVVLQPGFVHVRVVGRIDEKRLLGVYDEVLDRHAGVPRLWDYRHADLTGLSSDSLSTISSYAAQREAEIHAPRVAVLVGRDVEFGITRMYDSIAEDRYPSVRRVFRDKEEAIEWLVKES